ncbi:uncharacterized protein [Gorilla gorilla gorilla]|uniref:uncharacterized protein isoform X3 n=1 Tax=Gorilla gorilla gorilla TaxID=9595 RepID=UPI002445B10A|nr:uncharacterized protein LOC129531757 isoform X3 [Gorilla gorilla gorilla]
MFFFIKERNQLFRTGPHLSSGVISVLHRSAELGALYRTLSSLKYPSWRVRTPHDGEALCTLQKRTNHTEISYGTHSGT